MGKTVTYLILCSGYFVNIEITNEATKELFVGQGQIIETRILGIFALFQWLLIIGQSKFGLFFKKIKR